MTNVTLFSILAHFGDRGHRSGKALRIEQCKWPIIFYISTTCASKTVDYLKVSCRSGSPSFEPVNTPENEIAMLERTRVYIDVGDSVTSNIPRHPFQSLHRESLAYQTLGSVISHSYQGPEIWIVPKYAAPNALMSFCAQMQPRNVHENEAGIGTKVLRSSFSP